jgi:DNA polymerase-4
VVSTCSYEARAFGVHSAMPAFEARRLCPEGIFVRGSMRRYGAESKRIFEIFRRFTPLVQGLSLDEAFLDVSGTERLFGPPAQLAEQLRAAVRAEVGLAVSVGIAPVKLVAKIASDLAKPDGLLEVAPEAVVDFLAPLPVRRLWGVGPVAGERLTSAGYHSIGDLARADTQRLEALLGAWGAQVSKLARGEDVSEVEPYREAVSYSEENTFDGDVSDPRVLRSAIIAHAEAVARRLRSDGLRARTVVLKLKLSRRVAAGPRGYPLLSRRTTLAEPTDDGDTISRAAFDRLARADLKEPIRLLGVGASNLVGRASEQLGLFAPEADRERRSRLNTALDELTRRYGSGVVTRGAMASPERAGLTHQHNRGDDPE